MPTAVILNLPEHGHLNATFPLVSELVKRGERVIYYATEPHRDRIEAAGAEFRSYGEARAFEPPAHQGGLYSVMAHLIQLTEAVLPRLIGELEQDRPDYLLIDSMCVWGRLVQQITGLPAATLASVFVPDETTVSVEEMVRLAYGRAPKEVLLAGVDALNTYIEVSQRIDHRYGTLSPNIVEFFANRQPLNIVFTSREFHPMGDRYDDSYKFVGPSIAARHDTPDLNFDASDTRPLIYISLGTIFNDQPEFYRNCFEALADSPYRVVLATGSKVDAGSLTAPANFCVRPYVPQLPVLSQASVFLTHCGMNSASEALWYGVPLVMFPQHGDQHLVASRVAEAGAGLMLPPGDAGPAQIRALVDQAHSDPAFRHNAQRIGESFRAAGGYRRAAEEILAFTAEAHPCRQSA